MVFLIPKHAAAQCNQVYNFASWNTSSDQPATGTIINNGQIIKVSMEANYRFSFSPGLFGYTNFNRFTTPIPNVSVPRTQWDAGTGGVTRMCFDTIVSNPILILSSLGSSSTPVTLKFSTRFELIYNGGGVRSFDDTTMTGQEADIILLFPGNFQCVTIYSTTPEVYTNISWGLNPPLFPVRIDGRDDGCGSVTLTASGGERYLWSGGINPNSATNTFVNTGTYLLTVTDRNGCTVKTSRQIKVSSRIVTDTSVTICKGGSFYGYTLPGRYVDTIRTNHGCDTIRHIRLIQNPYSENKISKTICKGESYEGHSASGTYRDTLRSIAGCDSLVTLTELTVLQDCEINFPNAFSPNGDSKNEVFRLINGHRVEAFRLEIFNRFGQKVFETNDHKAGWNGQYKGVLQARGIYVWRCTFTQTGITLRKKGAVALIN
ncbi:MAG: gliding motility-associated C-terminal domain-containing protein [Chitinophagaceae bacterium]|nr:MAG: gliding motility-associated C-terminal domain-containing protein [Chitinophagaceae bacterium]